VRRGELGGELLVGARADELDAVAEVVLVDDALEVRALGGKPFFGTRRPTARIVRTSAGGGGLGRKRSRSTPCGMSWTGAPTRRRSPATSGLQAMTHAAPRARSASPLRLTLRASTAWTLKP
jgi:hypothetical protein